jgi:hypothetical protein
MPRTADVALIGAFHLANQEGAGTQYLVKTPAGVLYCICINALVDVGFTKSLDNGLTWSGTTSIFSGSATALAIWYDKWSNLAGELIHCAYQESGTDDTLYRTIDTASADALSTQTVILAGTSTQAGGALSIARSRGGNVYCATMIDAGIEGGFMRLLNANVPNGAWDAARTTVWEASTQDQIILLPGWAADNQDMMAFFWDASADEISSKLYDDSANSWGESSIATGMVDTVATTQWPMFAAAVDITNSRNLLAAWTQADLANADLRCWHVTESAITEVTNVVLNSTDDQGMVSIGIDTATQDWYVFYCGKSDGSETYPTSIHIYCKISTDDGTTWGAENQVSNFLIGVSCLVGCPRFTLPIGVLRMTGTTFWEARYIAPIVQPHAAHQMFGG